MKQMLENNDDNLMRQRSKASDLHHPHRQPEGLDVVTSGRDDTYRKNCPDNIGRVLRIQDVNAGHSGWISTGIRDALDRGDTFQADWNPLQ